MGTASKKKVFFTSQPASSSESEYTSGSGGMFSLRKSVFPPVIPSSTANRNLVNREKKKQARELNGIIADRERSQDRFNLIESRDEASNLATDDAISDRWTRLKYSRSRIAELRKEVRKMRQPVSDARRLKDEADNKMMHMLRPLWTNSAHGRLDATTAKSLRDGFNEMQKTRTVFHYHEFIYESAERDLEHAEKDLELAEAYFFSAVVDEQARLLVPNSELQDQDVETPHVRYA